MTAMRYGSLGAAALLGGWTACASVSCAGLVGITDVPGGDAGVVRLLDGGRVILPDGKIIGLDAWKGYDGFTGFDAGHPPGDVGVPPGRDGSNPGFDTGTGSPLTYSPSNIGTLTFDPAVTGPLTLNGDNCVLRTDDVTISCASGQNPPMDMFPVTLAGGAGQALVFAFTYISIDSQSQLQIRGMMPAIIIALGALDLQGSIDVSADNYDSASNIDVIPGSRTTGPGIGGFGNSGGPQAGGGGSFCGVGGYGAPGPTGGFPPGMAYGNATMVPLWGGSAGGGANTGGADQTNGNGGGAIQISAAGSITVHPGAYINANGSGGVSQGNEQGEGAGSGGGILLEAPTVTIDGILEANGGEGSDENSDGANPPVDGGVATEPSCLGGNGGAGAVINGSNGGMTSGGYGGGGGGVGWIRINGTTVSITGTVSPAIGSGCASQGPLP